MRHGQQQQLQQGSMKMKSIRDSQAHHRQGRFRGLPVELQVEGDVLLLALSSGANSFATRMPVSMEVVEVHREISDTIDCQVNHTRIHGRLHPCGIRGTADRPEGQNGRFARQGLGR